MLILLYRLTASCWRSSTNARLLNTSLILWTLLVQDQKALPTSSVCRFPSECTTTTAWITCSATRTPYFTIWRCITSFKGVRISLTRSSQKHTTWRRWTRRRLINSIRCNSQLTLINRRIRVVVMGLGMVFGLWNLHRTQTVARGYLSILHSRQSDSKSAPTQAAASSSCNHTCATYSSINVGNSTSAPTCWC